MAMQARVQGIVVVAAQVDATGKVSKTNAVTGPRLLREAAIETVRLCKYEPALINGKPVLADITVNVEFRLQ
jgi:protein TonB